MLAIGYSEKPFYFKKRDIRCGSNISRPMAELQDNNKRVAREGQLGYSLPPPAPSPSPLDTIENWWKCKHCTGLLATFYRNNDVADESEIFCNLRISFD